MLSNKVEILAESARYDVCLSSCSSGASGKPGRVRKPENPLHEWIYPASVPGQGTVHILKILQSNKCRNNCTYCKFAASNDAGERFSLTPDELASAFMELVRKRLVWGIFLSSGVCRSPSFAMEEMVKTADILRRRYRFGGYIHIKVIPGCAEHLIDSAAALADRLSINMEAPTVSTLEKIAPDKNLKKDILPAVSRISGLLQLKKQNYSDRRIKAASQTTQFVVGAADESDMLILGTVDKLYRDFFMFRSYFSAYQKQYNSAASENAGPQKQLNGFEGTPLLREHRLYQCDFLLRAYGFRYPELVFDSGGNIPLETDPKTAWAMLNPQLFPVEINTAGFEDLIRVPGIGPVSAERIITMRREARITSIDELKSAGAWSKRAAGWIELNGQTPFISDPSPAARRGREPHFDPAQRWLFEEIAPEGWRTASSVGGKDKADTDYVYPGQQGKWVNYRFKRNDKKIMCR